jgi:pseudouridine synthase
VERLILSGQVTINGEVVSELGRRIVPETDVVAVAGNRVQLPTHWQIYAFHKPRGVVSSLRSQGGQTCLAPFRKQAELPVSVIPVGRLDAETTGLLLWTDDGELAQILCRPASRIWKIYEVVLATTLSREQGEIMATGQLELDGRVCLPLKIVPGSPEDGRHWILHLHEGRKRQIRRMFDQLGHEVLVLHRVQYGPITLGRLREGCFRLLTRQEEYDLRSEAGQTTMA